MRYLVLDNDGFVINIIVWDGVSKIPTRNQNVVLESNAPIGATFGWQLVNNEWIALPVIEQPEE
jgi:hypothetical protein